MSKPGFVYVTYIETTAEKLWQALTSSDFTALYCLPNDSRHQPSALEDQQFLERRGEVCVVRSFHRYSDDEVVGD